MMLGIRGIRQAMFQHALLTLTRMSAFAHFIFCVGGAQAIEPVVLATEAEPPQRIAPAPKPQQPSDLLTPSTGESPLIDI